MNWASLAALGQPRLWYGALLALENSDRLSEAGTMAQPERPIPKRRRARGTAPIAAVHILWSAVKAGTPARHRFHCRLAPEPGPNGFCQSGV